MANIVTRAMSEFAPKAAEGTRNEATFKYALHSLLSEFSWFFDWVSGLAGGARQR